MLQGDLRKLRNCEEAQEVEKNKKRWDGQALPTEPRQGMRPAAQLLRPDRRVPTQHKAGAVLIVPKDGKPFVNIMSTLGTVDNLDKKFKMRRITKTRDDAVLLCTK